MSEYWLPESINVGVVVPFVLLNKVRGTQHPFFCRPWFPSLLSLAYMTVGSTLSRGLTSGRETPFGSLKVVGSPLVWCHCLVSVEILVSGNTPGPGVQFSDIGNNVVVR